MTMIKTHSTANVFVKTVEAAVHRFEQKGARKQRPGVGRASRSNILNRNCKGVGAKPLEKSSGERDSHAAKQVMSATQKTTISQGPVERAAAARSDQSDPREASSREQERKRVG
jgi:hypothetical protein